MSSFQRLLSTQMWHLRQMKVSCLWRCLQFRGVLIQKFHHSNLYVCTHHVCVITFTGLAAWSNSQPMYVSLSTVSLATRSLILGPFILSNRSFYSHGNRRFNMYVCEHTYEKGLLCECNQDTFHRTVQDTHGCCPKHQFRTPTNVVLIKNYTNSGHSQILS